MPLLKGDSKAIVGANIRELMSTGRDQKQSVAIAMDTARKSNHKNLKGYLHKRKDGKPHGHPKD